MMRGEIAHELLRHVRLQHLIDPVDGVPHESIWDRLETCSSGERVMVQLALAILDYSVGEHPCRLSDLMWLDRANLRAAGEALRELAEQ
jgi:hypothetical protein